MELSYEVFHKDVHALVNFYVDVLGFNAPGADPSADYVVVRRDGIRIGCCLHPEAEPNHRKPPHGSEIVLRVDDLHAEYDRVAASGWRIEDDLQKRPWGLTDFRVFDPTGQYLRITDNHTR